jgi:hypothetical protein
MLLRLRLDNETAGRLCDMALRELRTVDSEAIVLLRAGLGLPVPLPPLASERERAVPAVVTCHT